VGWGGGVGKKGSATVEEVGGVNTGKPVCGGNLGQGG